MLKPLDRALAHKLIEETEDVLTPAIQNEREMYRRTRCPRCFQSGYCVKRVDAPKVEMTPEGPKLVRSPFSPSELLVDGFAHCNNCDTEFCPRSGIIRHVTPFITDVQQPDPHQA